MRDCVCVSGAVIRGEGSISHITADGRKFEDEESKGSEGASPLPTTQGLSLEATQTSEVKDRINVQLDTCKMSSGDSTLGGKT